MTNLSKAFNTVLKENKQFIYSISKSSEVFDFYKEHIARQDVLEVSQIANKEGFDNYLSQFIFENSDILCKLGFGLMIERSRVFDDVIFFNIIEKINQK